MPDQVSLRDHLESVLAAAQAQLGVQVDALERRVDMRAELVERATEQRIVDTREALRIATAQLEERLGLLNELRVGVLPRESFDEYVTASAERYRAASTGLNRRIDDLRDQVNTIATQVAKGPPELPALATKVEADVSERITRTEYESKHADLINEINRVRQDVANLATQVAVGPPDLPKIAQALANQAGEGRGRLSTLQLVQSFLVLAVMVTTIVVTVLIANHA